MKRLVILALTLCMTFGIIGCSSVSQSATFTDETEAEALTYRDVAVFIQSQLESKFSYTDISYDETGMNIFLSNDGISDACRLALSGTSSKAEPWKEILSSTEKLSKSIADAFSSIGCDDYVTSVVIVDDLNADNMLAMFLNGKLIYDTAGTNK